MGGDSRTGTRFYDLINIGTETSHHFTGFAENSIIHTRPANNDPARVNILPTFQVIFEIFHHRMMKISVIFFSRSHDSVMDFDTGFDMQHPDSAHRLFP